MDGRLDGVLVVVGEAEIDGIDVGASEILGALVVLGLLDGILLGDDEGSVDGP